MTSDVRWRRTDTGSANKAVLPSVIQRGKVVGEPFLRLRNDVAARIDAGPNPLVPLRTDQLKVPRIQMFPRHHRAASGHRVGLAKGGYDWSKRSKVQTPDEREVNADRRRTAGLTGASASGSAQTFGFSCARAPAVGQSHAVRCLTQARLSSARDREEPLTRGLILLEHPLRQ